MTLTKKEFVSRLAENRDCPKAEANRIINDVIDTLRQSLIEGYSVRFPEFGNFEVRRKEEREIYSPLAGGVVTVPEHNYLRFVPSDALKERIKNGAGNLEQD